MADASSLYQRMRNVLAQWVDMPAAKWGKFRSIFEVKTFQKHDPVLLPGSEKHELFFVGEGLLRVYTVAEDGTESNKGFKTEDAFVGPLAAFMLGLPSMYGMEALEPSTLLAGRYDALNDLYQQHPVFDRLGRKLMEQIVIQKELRERISLHQTAEERYLAFVEQYPRFAQRVPQYHIASYLGITAESLSRVRSGLAKNSTS